MSGETGKLGQEAESIPREILAAIYRQARAEFPSECCGYLRGRGPETVAGGRAAKLASKA